MTIHKGWMFVLACSLIVASNFDILGWLHQAQPTPIQAAQEIVGATLFLVMMMIKKENGHIDKIEMMRLSHPDHCAACDGRRNHSMPHMPMTWKEYQDDNKN